MSSWMSTNSWTASVTLKTPEDLVGQILFGSSSEYTVVELIGEGCFGKVAKCQNLATEQAVAVKILKEDTAIIQDTEKELSMLKAISALDPDHVNMVKFLEQFDHMGQRCLVFEMLDRSLYDHIEQQNWKALSLNEIRPIGNQLLVALDALKSLGILHADIKPDNIMFVSVQDQPLRVKLIDFGEAISASEIQLGMELQPTGYRAPEVALGLPFTEAIDVWGVGCILAFLYLAENLFPVHCDYQMMKCMVEVLGQPEEHQLRAGIYTQYFFSEEKTAGRSTWRLMTPKEYLAANSVNPEQSNSFTELPSSLDDLIYFHPAREAAEPEDRRAFVSLLKQLLHLDGDQRISPRQALQHPFLTMSHLTDHPDSRADLTTSENMVSVCPVEGSETVVNTSPHSPAGSYTRSLASASAATVLYHDSPTLWSSDRVLIATSCDEDRGASSSDRDQAKDSCEETPGPGFIDRGRLSFSFDQDPVASSSNSGLPSASYNQDPAASSFDETKPTYFTPAAPASSVHSKKLLRRIQSFFRQAITFCCCWLPPVED